MNIVIMAGGKGTRIASVASDIPKPLIPVEGVPVLHRVIDCAVRQGFTDITLVTGHLGEMIEESCGDGSRLGCSIKYFRETEPLGTAGALYHLYDSLSDDFYLLNADAVMDIDLSRMRDFHFAHGGAATVLVHPNSHPFDSSLLAVGKDFLAEKWYKKGELRSSYRNRVNAGVHILRKAEIKRFLDGSKRDLDRDILTPLVNERRVYAYESPEYIKDMGTPGRYAEVCADVRSGKVSARNLSSKQRAVFLDRDGTLNVYKGFVTSPDMIELIPGVAEAVKMINRSDMLAIMISNQPVVARGDCTFEQLDEINGRLEALLGDEGAYLDDIFCCPHHPDKGFDGERPELKFDCDCRKPKPGLILQAAGKYNIDISRSVMVGDRLNDLLCGKNAGCAKTVFLGSELPDGAPEGAERYDSLLSFTQNNFGN